MRRNFIATPRYILLGALAVVALSSCIRVRASATRGPAPADSVVRQDANSGSTAGGGAGLSGAPAAASADVMRTVKRLFDGMRAGDSAMVRSAFDSNPRLVTTAVRNGVSVLRSDSVDAFVRAVGTPHAEVWDERISGEIVQIDGPLATVWMRYSFYAGEQFSHCGVNAFELIRRPDGWRITSIADTRRRERCDESGD